MPTLSLERCPLCDHPLGEEAFGTTYTDLWDNRDRHRYTYRPCVDCNLLVLANPPKPGPALAEFYAHRGGCSFLDWQHRHPLVRWYTRSLQQRKLTILNRLVPLTATSRVLEVGTGKGAFAALLAERVGCEVHANDLASELAAHMHPAVQYHPGPCEELEDWGDAFDLVISHQVIEHVYDPRRFLEMNYALLKPGGTLVIETINTESASFRTFEENWGQLCAPRHTVLYTDRFFRERLPSFLSGASIEIHYDGYAAAFGLWASSAIHALHLPMATSRLARGIAGLLYLAITPWSVWLERLARERGIITVVVRKPDLAARD